MPDRMVRYLNEHGVAYARLPHVEAFTAQETAQELHVPGQLVAKVVIVRLDGSPAMIVVPAPYAVDFTKLRVATGARDATLASEAEIQELFPDCELGGLPPYGNLYGVPVYVAKPLAADDEILFEAGTRHEALRMKYADFARLVSPVVLDITTHVH